MIEDTFDPIEERRRYEEETEREAARVKEIDEQYASLERKRKDTCRRICLERTRAEAEEREFYLEDYYPSRWIKVRRIFSSL